MGVLNNLPTDYESLVNALIDVVKTDPTYGKSLYPSDAARFFTALIAGVHSQLNYKLLASVNNNYQATATSPYSIYANAIKLGDKIRRSVGASMTVELTTDPLSTSIVIPAYSKFTFNNQSWYNNIDINLSPGQTTSVFTIYQGQYSEEIFTSNGNAFQEFTLQVSGFNIDDNSVKVMINNELWDKDTQTLIKYESSSKVYLESTNPQGQVVIQFGNGVYGVIPPLNNTITISYAITLGASSNSTALNAPVILDSIINLPNTGGVWSPSIINITKAVGGDDREDSNIIKFTSPRIFASQNRAVTRQDHIALLTKYPTVKSVNVWGEYEQSLIYGRNSPEFRNQIYYSLIKKDVELKYYDAGVLPNSPTFNVSLPDLNIIKGSLSIKINSITFYDIGGYLVTDNYFTNIIDGTGVASSDYPTNDNPPINAFDNNAFTYYSSSQAPTNLNPVSLTYKFSSPQSINSIRIIASPINDYSDRAYPSVLELYGSNLSDPDPSIDDEWDILRGEVNLQDPGSSGASPWILVSQSNTTYSSIRLKIYDRYGQSNSVKLSELQLQVNSNLSTIDYTTSQINLIIDSEYLHPGDSVLVSYYESDYSANEIDAINKYLKPYMIMNNNLNYVSPIIQLVDIKANIYYISTNVIDPNTIINNVTSKLKSTFNFSINSINTVLATSDIVTTIYSSDKSIDYVDLLTPSSNVNSPVNGVFVINNITLNLIKSNRSKI